MIERSALPDVICADCGHPPYRHRHQGDATQETCAGAPDGGTCPCLRTAQVVEHAAEVVLAAQKAERHKLGYAMLVSTLACVLAGGGSFGLSAWNTKQSEQKMCEVLALSSDNGRRQLEAYDRQPPTTPAGQEQMKQLKVGVDAVVRLEHSLGCDS